MLAVVEEELAALAKPHGRGLVELRVSGVVHAAVDDHARAVHAFGDPTRAIRDVLGDEGLDVDPADVLTPGIDAKSVELRRRHEVEVVPREHLALGTAKFNLLTKGQTAAQRVPPQNLVVVVRDVEVGAILAGVARFVDPSHVRPEILEFTLGRLEHEGRFVATLERQLFQTADVVSVGVRGDQMLHVMNRETKLRHLQRRLGAQIHEQRRAPLHDDDVRLKHRGGEGGADAEKDDPQMTIGGQRQRAFVLPNPDARCDEMGQVIAQIQFSALEHDRCLQKALTPQRCTPSSAVKMIVLQGGIIAQTSDDNLPL